MALEEKELRCLVSQANAGDSGALSRLVSEMIPIVRAQAAGFGKVSGTEDSEDIFQEGMIGILSAVRTYKEDGGASFRTYASVCTRHRIVSAVKRASAGGRSVRSQNAVSIEDYEFAGGELSVEESLIVRERCGQLLSHIRRSLSEKERTVLRLFLSGLSYQEIAGKLGSSPKSVDNALQRVRQKLKKYH